MATTLFQLLKDSADHSPLQEAILAPGRQSLNYAGLFQFVQTTIRQLHRYGIGRNDPVGIVLPNGPEMATAFLGVSCTATSAPLNPGYHENEFQYYLEDLNARAILIPYDTKTPARNAAKKLDIPIIEVSFHPEDPSGIFSLHGQTVKDSHDSELVQDEDIGLVLHTSGTTSQPKIVPLSHKNITASALHIKTSLHLTPGDRCLNIMPLFHIHGLMAATLASLVGSSGVICCPGFKSEYFFKWYQKTKPTWYTAVPTMHQAVLGQAAAYKKLIQQIPLRFVRSSSSSLPPQIMTELIDTFHAPVIEAYGMTEASHQMTCNPLPPKTQKPGSVGLPAGPEVAIMDEHGDKLLSAEKKGEIVIRGPNVTIGYANNPKANAQAFCQGWFRTGDQGYRDKEGYYYITGRLKEIINRGGEKISPREVDEILMDHPSIQQVVTFAIPHRTLGEDMGAAVVLKPGHRATVQEIRAYAFSKMTAEKVPSQVIFLKDIPKGPTGKLQRIGLADKLQKQLNPEFVSPKTSVEIRLAEIWQDVLPVQKVGKQDNFFLLGGDSLSAAQVISRIKNHFGIFISLKKVFEGPTLTKQAAMIEKVLAEQIEDMTEKEAKEQLQQLKNK